MSKQRRGAIVGLAFAAVVASCAPSPIPAARPSPSPPVASCAPTSATFGIDGIWLGNGDSGCTARLHPGNQVFVELRVSGGYGNWSGPQSSDDRVLSEEPVFWITPGGVTAAHFRAAATGAATLTATSRTYCGSDLSACRGHLRTWHVAITVVA